jgi:hypothetical protein
MAAADVVDVDRVGAAAAEGTAAAAVVVDVVVDVDRVVGGGG